jgi:hypothetical protein
MWALLSLLPALVAAPAPAEQPAPLRHALHDPFVVWEQPGVTWLGDDGAPTPGPRLAEPLTLHLAPRAADEALLAILPPDGRVTLAARSGQLLIVDGPATVRLHAEGGLVHALIRGGLDPEDLRASSVRALGTPEGWREGPWPRLDEDRCPDFRPPWGRDAAQLALWDALRPRLEAASNWLVPLANGDRPLPTRARRAARGSLTLGWSEALERRGPLDVLVTSLPDAVPLERWRGLSGQRLALLAPLRAGGRYRVSVTPVSGALGPEPLTFEVLSEDDETALDETLRGLEALTDRLGEPAVAVLTARALESWGLDDEARERWWGLYLAHERHPQAPHLLARAFAAPP